jgi:hypothetical protein
MVGNQIDMFLGLPPPALPQPVVIAPPVNPPPNYAAAAAAGIPLLPPPPPPAPRTPVFGQGNGVQLNPAGQVRFNNHMMEGEDEAPNVLDSYNTWGYLEIG